MHCISFPDRKEEDCCHAATAEERTVPQKRKNLPAFLLLLLSLRTLAFGRGAQGSHVGLHQLCSSHLREGRCIFAAALLMLQPRAREPRNAVSLSLSDGSIFCGAFSQRPRFSPFFFLFQDEKHLCKETSRGFFLSLSLLRDASTVNKRHRQLCGRFQIHKNGGGKN